MICLSSSPCCLLSIRLKHPKVSSSRVPRCCRKTWLKTWMKLLFFEHPFVVNHDDGKVWFTVRKDDSSLPPRFSTSVPLRGTSVHVFLDDPIEATYKHVRLSSTKHLARALHQAQYRVYILLTVIERLLRSPACVLASKIGLSTKYNTGRKFLCVH
jgi:hypothetical protein